MVFPVLLCKHLPNASLACSKAVCVGAEDVNMAVLWPPLPPRARNSGRGRAESFGNRSPCLMHATAAVARRGPPEHLPVIDSRERGLGRLAQEGLSSGSDTGPEPLGAE